MPLFDPGLRALATQPSVAVALTVGCYWLALRMSRLCRQHPLANPTFIGILLVAAVLKVAGVDAGAYAQSAGSVSLALALAVVLLAVPLYRQRALIRESGLMIAGTLAVALPAGIGSGVGIASMLGADRQTLLSLAPKSTTAGVAMGISERIGGLPALTAVLVIMTGIVGAMLAPLTARLMRMDDPRAVGLALGITSHGIGTARALQMGEVTGAFSGLGMALNAVATALLLPAAIILFHL